MGDFILDFRDQGRRRDDCGAASLRFYNDMEVERHLRDTFSLGLVRPDGFHNWGSFISPDGKMLVALSGRIFLEPAEWIDAEKLAGEGGVACKAIHALYREGGLERLERLNGNFVVIIHDTDAHKLHLITDRCGMHPCFVSGEGRNLLIGSHPDILAETANCEGRVDLVSLCEFLVTGKVSYPYTYYKSVKALNFGSIHTVDLAEGANKNSISSRKYFPMRYRIDHGRSEWELAEELAQAFRKAVNRRTLDRFGQSAISLSGGLDSRAILCSADNRERLKAFCFFDEENFELNIARRIAKKTNVSFIPLRRDFDYYGAHAQMGIRISGGMGDFGSNHYLGFRDTFREKKIENIITGCYCDYFFKGLALDKKSNSYLNRESLSAYRGEFYTPYFWNDTPMAARVRDRLEEIFPVKMKEDGTGMGRLAIEGKRLFPLCYEADSQQRVVPQRVLGWSLPIVDNDIVDTYLKVPPSFKMNVSFYSKMASLACGKEISRITNSNTGAPVNASAASQLFHRYQIAAKRRVQRWKGTIATAESWPNWPFYIANSCKIEQLWMEGNGNARDLFREILGSDPYSKKIQEYRGRDLKLFRRLLTLKTWIDRRFTARLG